MKLTDLKPKWVQLAQWAMKEEFYIGVSFLCPCCRGRRLAVYYWPPIDPHHLLGTLFDLPETPGAHKRVSGEAFADLTIEPSIGFDSIGHWHGRITKGEVVP